MHSENKSAMLYNFVTAIFSSEGFSGGSQSSVAGYSQLPFPTASQTHLTSGIQGGNILNINPNNRQMALI